MATSSTGRPIGRPSKGTRIRAASRLPVSTHIAASKSAVASGKTLSDWVAEAIEQRLERERDDRPR